MQQEHDPPLHPPAPPSLAADSAGFDGHLRNTPEITSRTVILDPGTTLDFGRMLWIVECKHKESNVGTR